MAVMYDKSIGKKNLKRGRPRLGLSKKTEIIRIRLTKAELKLLAVEATKMNLTVPQLLMMPWRKEG